MTRTLTTLNLGVLALLTMTAASEASIQVRLDSTPAIFVARASSLEVAMVPARDIDLAPCPALWGGNADSVSPGRLPMVPFRLDGSHLRLRSSKWCPP